MLVFVDESGDTGFKIDTGSSKYFVVSLVVFEDEDEGCACDNRISLLRRELGYSEFFEFHFQNNSKRIRTNFLQAVAPYNFFYFGIVLNKNPNRLYGEGFKVKESLYKYTCGLVFENAKPYLKEAIVIIDKSGSSLFRYQLANYLKKKINTKEIGVIKKVKMESSKSNNLLQLADYVAGVINRKVQRKQDAVFYHKFIATKEMYVQVWPK
ncbi:MAG: DUF3800 domain-containing protein [bacterium]